MKKFLDKVYKKGMLEVGLSYPPPPALPSIPLIPSLPPMTPLRGSGLGGGDKTAVFALVILHS
jgi:hypothetical protein